MEHPNNRKGRQIQIIASGTREQVIGWLTWNDPNGVYTDQQSRDEGQPVLTLREAVRIMVEQLTECDPCPDYRTAEHDRFGV